MSSTSINDKKLTFINELQAFYKQLKSSEKNGFPFFLFPLFEQEHEKGSFQQYLHFNTSTTFHISQNKFSIASISHFLFIKKLLKYASLKMILKITSLTTFQKFKSKRKSLKYLWITYCQSQNKFPPFDNYDNDFKIKLFPNQQDYQIVYLPIHFGFIEQIKTSYIYQRYSYLNLFLFFSPFSFLINYMKAISLIKKTRPGTSWLGVEFDQQVKKGLFIDNLLIFTCWSRLKKSISDTPLKIIYPFENLNWEKSLNFIFKENSQTIGFLHSSIPQYYLNFYLNLKDTSLSPTYLSYNNEKNRLLLLPWWGKSLKLFPGGHLRGKQTLQKTSAKIENCKIGLILPIGAEHCTMAESSLCQLPETISGVSWELFVHPNCQYHWAQGKLKHKISTLPSHHAISSYRAVVIINSSVFIEAILNQRPFIIFRPSNHLAEAAEDLLPDHFFVKADDLETKINDLLQFPEKYQINEIDQWKFISPNISEWKKFI